MPPSPASSPTPYQRWQQISALVLRWFHIYAGWLVSISWKNFIILAVLLLIGANMVSNLPPFTWRITEQVEESSVPRSKLPRLPPAHKAEKPEKAEKAAKPADSRGIHYEISIDERGVRVVPKEKGSDKSGDKAASEAAGEEGGVNIPFPASGDRAEIRRAVEEARASLEKIAENARDAQERAEQEAQEALDAKQAAEEVRAETERLIEQAQNSGPQSRVRVIHFGDFLVDLAALWVLGSVLIKITYKGRIQAEVKAAQATETAEAESLKRQVIEARMAAMQAQVEPHFLFNTLASIDHLIETDPPRASQMQKNLIALLRASMPTMREANASGVRDLGRELAVIKPYLEILQMRMEERLQTEIAVPEGLLSAEFPPMMIQSLVENAIKHGLEPKAEGGSLLVKAEVTHGKLAVTVADTGLGFGRAATAGTGVGLANIRERLMILYGSRASVTVTENQPSGTVVTITVPYRSRADDQQGASA
ncbi:sensor histidine kinase [Paucibacter sp. DJ2R-2]|uniref:sensor histidine kinase n=1 Tax=Paucibacter sp. DJ2R-2 TaxID=2893558 RepID=UPI0021E4D29D|nr:histidine kinase [Paucibacter sp. DJ2R-2]MCV2421007.1 histidine kinase [Paucibacter sp. DJ4R-1]MCV2438985.1 histidine kinase [Paucibacter sp. DJ2R-2]